jgi:hypothetical protein
MTRRAAAVALRSSSSSRTMPGAGSRLAVNRIVAVALAGHERTFTLEAPTPGVPAVPRP